MVILQGILNESWDHYRNMEKKILAQLKKLPHGSVYKRRIGKNHYFYLSVRNGEKVQSKYLGKEIPAELEKQIKDRRLLEKQKKDVLKNLKFLSKTLKKKNHG